MQKSLKDYGAFVFVPLFVCHAFNRFVLSENLDKLAKTTNKSLSNSRMDDTGVNPLCCKLILLTFFC